MDGGVSVQGRRWSTSFLVGLLVVVAAALAVWIASGGLCSILRCAPVGTLSDAAPRVIYVPDSAELAAADLPVIVADAAHHDLGRGSQPAIYDIPAGAGFVLDTGGLPLHIPADMQLSGPNRVFLTVRGTPYHLKWEPDKSMYLLSSETLEPWLESSAPFAGLKAGQDVTISVGYWDEAGVQTGNEQFVEMWKATAVVR